MDSAAPPTGADLLPSPTFQPPNTTNSHILPKVTTGSSEEFMHRSALISAHATLKDPFNFLLNAEKLSPGADTTPTVDQLYTANMGRLRTKASQGALLVEAGDFAAVAVWEPPHCTKGQDDGFEKRLMDVEESGRLLFLDFLQGMEDAKDSVLGKGEGREGYWQMSLLARDVGKAGVKGAVRAVLEFGLERARREGRKVWLAAGNERARDIYKYFGWRVVEQLVVGKDVVGRDGRRKEGGEGVSTWLMVREWSEEERSEQSKVVNGV